MKRVLISLLLLLPLALPAQESDRFGSWLFLEANKSFDNGLSLMIHNEHDTYEPTRFDCGYVRVSVGYKVLKWLKVGVNYAPLCSADHSWSHYGEAEVVGTLKSGDLSVSIRERYRHGFTNGKNELRSRLKVAYSLPDTPWGFYVAPEVFTRGNDWLRTRHYCSCTYDLNPYVQFETYYMYYAFKNTPPENVLGLGFNFHL